MFCLYQITNLTNGKYYIGVHCDSANTAYMGSGLGIRRAIKKHGRERFRKDILAEVENESFAYQLEAAVVDQTFVDRPDTYNMKVGGYGGAWNTGIPATMEARRKQSLARQGRTPMLGKTHSIATRLKMSLSRIGNTSRVGISPWIKGKKHSLEARQKSGAVNIGNTYSVGRVVSPETRQKIRETLRRNAKAAI